ncbi:MAG TPA: glycosyl hydrolase family 28-related protein [Acidobacteriaceae bacterium]
MKRFKILHLPVDASAGIIRTLALATGALLSVAAGGCGAGVSPNAAVTAAAAGFPADSGMLNVRDFGALGDGKTDDTAAILAAVAASGADTGAFWWQDRIVYFPDGVYMISAQIIKQYSTGYASGMVLVGQSQANTILKLKDYAAGYQTPTAPQAMVFMTSKLIDADGPYGGGKDYPGLGEGNDAYKNSIENMTLNVGSGNPGAVGIDYLANNLGAIRQVTVTAPAGSGTTGISMLRKWIGPALLEHVTVHGFNVGIDVANTEYGVTLNHVALNGQFTAGLRNNQNSISANDLEVNSVGSAIISTALDGLIVLAQAQLSSSSATTVQNTLGTILFRASRVSNYQKFTGGSILGDVIDGALTGPAAWTAKTSAQFIPVEDPPSVVQEASSSWVSVGTYGAVPVSFTNSQGAPLETPTDSLAAFQAAFATGASTIYLPHGLYYLSNNLQIPSTVQRIVGMDSTIRVYQTGGYKMNRAQGMFRVLDSTGMAPLQIEKLAFDNSNYGTQLALEQASTRPLIVQDMVFAGALIMNRAATGGKVFLTDISCAGCVGNVIAGTAAVTGVQVDVEHCQTCFYNQGADFNILGLKTEGIETVVAATGGRTQVLGGLIYMVSTNTSPSMPAFSATNAVLTASFVEEAFYSTTHYTYLLNDTQNGVSTLTPESSFPTRDTGSYGRIVPWLQTAIH